VTSKNLEAQEQLRKNALIVMMSRQSLGVNKEINQLEKEKNFMALGENV